MNNEKQEQITLWQGSLDEHPTWEFYRTEISRVYFDLNTERDRAYVGHELIKRAAKAEYVEFLEDSAINFLKTYARMTYDQASNMVEAISKSIGRVVIKRENE